MEELKIHDIKGLVEIPDNSFIFFVFICIFAFILILVFVLFAIKLFKNRNKSQRKIYFEKLDNLDFSNSKEASYEASKYLRLLAKTQREKNFVSGLIEELDKYKYKKEVPSFDENLKAKIHTFMDMCDV